MQSSLLRHLVITSTKERNMEIAEVIFLTLLNNRMLKQKQIKTILAEHAVLQTDYGKINRLKALVTSKDAIAR